MLPYIIHIITCKHKSYTSSGQIIVVSLQDLTMETDLIAANGKKVKALEVFAYALQYFKEQALKVRAVGCRHIHIILRLSAPSAILLDFCNMKT